MRYTIDLILEKSELSREECICYENKKRRTYEAVTLWDERTETVQKKAKIFVASVEVYLQWSLEKIERFSVDCALVLVDEKEQWNTQYMQYQNRLLAMKSDLVIIRNNSLISGYNILAEAMWQINYIVDAFQTAVINRSGLQKMTELFYDLLGNPAYIVDSSFKVLAIDRRNNMRELSAVWRRLEDHGYLQYDIITKMIQDNELSRMESEEKAQWISSAHFYTPFINYNIRRKKKIAGHLFIINMFRQITQGDIELSTILGQLVEKAMENDQKYQVQRGRMYEYFLADILSGKMTDKDEIKKQMQSLAYSENSFYMIAVLQYQEKRINEIAEERLFQLLEQMKGCKPIHYKENIVALLPLREKKEKIVLVQKIRQIAEQFSASAGISESFYGYQKMHICCMQALIALKYGRNRENTVYCFEDTALDYLNGILGEKKKLEILEPEGMQQLKEYDEQNHTDYMQTMKVYLDHERNVVETAEALFVHRNTLSYRVKKIEEITGLDLNDEVIRLRIQVCFLRQEQNKP